MASFERRNGKVKAIIRRKVNDGGPKSKTFSSMSRARLWAAQREAELTDIAEGQIPRHTLGEAFDRYAKEVSPGKRGGRWEVIRLEALPHTGGSCLSANLWLHSCSPALLAQWRDQRMREVAPGTVLRELGLLSAVFQRAIREWQWMRENPCKQIAKPAAPAHRDKVLTRQEIRMLLSQLGRKIDTVSGRCGLAFLFALRTGMRAGEICGLTWDSIQGNTATLPITKNGSARHVPLSRRAHVILNRINHHAIDKRVFRLTTASLDAIFRKARSRAGLVNVHFHDSRHTYATHVAAHMVEMGISFPEFLQIFGWKDPKYAMIYVNTKASDLANKLDQRIQPIRKV